MTCDFAVKNITLHYLILFNNLNTLKLESRKTLSTTLFYI